MARLVRRRILGQSLAHLSQQAEEERKESAYAAIVERDTPLDVLNESAAV
eukprot:CAMPEP_0174711650 /NCGR_PEP_ID=MMETSP1094-20130205/12900_1 /TAXON_ID=156173 /ORGANISM="Chrysochromulina brevifilum, Strain UTEX LB 985" /LENGTH=49 /DNA_ID=CAMNT_0015910615 /DNA_START=467 /DNA_END=616 /DNA_ORIENTATION=-